MKEQSSKAKHKQKHWFFSTFSGSRAPLNGLVSSPAFPEVLWIFLYSLVKTRTQKSIEFNRAGPKISLLHLIFIWMKLILYALLHFLYACYEKTDSFCLCPFFIHLFLCRGCELIKVKPISTNANEDKNVKNWAVASSCFLPSPCKSKSFSSSVF